MLRVHVLSALVAGGLLSAAPQPQPFRRPLVFEQNRGQAPAEVRWLARGSGYQVALTSEGATIIFEENAGGPSKTGVVPISQRPAGPWPPSFQAKYRMIRMKLAGSRPWKEMTGAEPTGGVSNYLQDANSKDSLTNIPHYSKVRVANVYEGIDLVFHSNGGDLEYDFVVAPGADPKRIQVVFEGMNEMYVDNKSGDLVLRWSRCSACGIDSGRPTKFDGSRMELAGR
jgi:hypothetical protein